MKISELKDKFDYLMQDSGGWKLYDLHIIAPYPTDSFFRELINHFNLQNKLYLYVDDGWSASKVEEIEQIFKQEITSYQIKRIAAENGRLVHAKIYFFKWINNDGKYIRHILIGSANASLSGFGGNAETYALIWRGDVKRLDEEKQYPIEAKYFTPLATDGKCNECSLEIGESSWISLPAIKTVSEASGSFDAWLQRGYLCHKFDPTANFGKFVVKTINPIPPTGGLAAFTQANLQSITASTQITDPYIHQSTVNIGRTSWKSRLFIETIYGHWTSEECYKNSHQNFSAGGAQNREDEIDLIKNMTKPQIKASISSFLGKLQTAARILGPSASNYIEMQNPSNIDSDYYSNIANAKFKKDKAMALDRIFADRYVHGYAFPSFPTIDEKSFDAFALSFCDEILLEINKGSTQNKLAKVLRNIIPNLGKMYAADLLAELRVNWKIHSKKVINYWR